MSFPNPDDPLDYTWEEIKLDIERIGADFKLPANFHCEVERSHILGEIVRTWADIPTLQMQRHEISFPSDWWEAVKERWFPEWLLKRYPVEYTKRVFDARLAFPEYHIENLGRPVSVLLEKRPT